MAFTVEDRWHMRRALRLAAKARGRTAPNPMVGAVIVKDGEVIAEGFHAKAGTDHAEVAALKQLPEGCDAMLVGAGTVRADDPHLTTRLPGGRGRDALRVILDGKRPLPVDAAVMKAGTLIATATEGRPAPPGVEVVVLSAGDDPD